MAALTPNLLLVDLSTGESSYAGFANWGEVADSNFAFLEDAVTESSNVAVTTTNVTLTAAEERSARINVTGALTGNRSLLTNDRKGFWIVSNNTTGDFALTFKPTSGNGYVVPQGGVGLFVCDGTNMVRVHSVGANGTATKPLLASKSTSYTALQSDDASVFEFTAVGTLAFKPAALLGSAWYCHVKANGGAVTLNPDASELVNGATTLVLADGTSALVICTGTAFRAIVIGDVTKTGAETLSNKALNGTLGLTTPATIAFTTATGTSIEVGDIVASGATITSITAGTGTAGTWDTTNLSATVATIVTLAAGLIEVDTFSVSGASAGIQIGNTAGRINFSNTGTGAYAQLVFYNANGQVGSVQTSGSGTSFLITSDERKKTNKRDFDAGALINALQIWHFDWKAGGDGYGVMAQECEMVFPRAIFEGTDGFLQADYPAFVPLLLKHNQELEARLAKIERFLVI